MVLVGCHHGVFVFDSSEWRSLYVILILLRAFFPRPHEGLLLLGRGNSSLGEARLVSGDLLGCSSGLSRTSFTSEVIDELLFDLVKVGLPDHHDGVVA